MGVIGGALGYSILKTICPAGDTGYMSGNVYAGQSKAALLLGETLWREIKDKIVIDFGCGHGVEAVAIASHGARAVIGIDIQEQFLTVARELAARAGVSDRCQFVQRVDEKADVIVSLDSFEHFANPGAVLRHMRDCLKSDGCVLASFGPTWYHPLGGHLFSVFPWAHLVFTEKALIRWRSAFKTDGATRFSEVAGGLNGMTIRRFLELVGESPFRLAEFEATPIRHLAPVANRYTREFTTAIVRCKLVPIS